MLSDAWQVKVRLSGEGGAFDAQQFAAACSERCLGAFVQVIQTQTALLSPNSVWAELVVAGTRGVPAVLSALNGQLVAGFIIEVLDVGTADTAQQWSEASALEGQLDVAATAAVREHSCS